MGYFFVTQFFLLPSTFSQHPWPMASSA